MVSKQEYLREKSRADAAEARVAELEAQLNGKPQQDKGLDGSIIGQEGENLQE